MGSLTRSGPRLGVVGELDRRPLFLWIHNFYKLAAVACLQLWLSLSLSLVLPYSEVSRCQHVRVLAARRQGANVVSERSEFTPCAV